MSISVTSTMIMTRMVASCGISSSPRCLTQKCISRFTATMMKNSVMFGNSLA